MNARFAIFLADYLANGIDNLHKAGMPMDFSKEGLQGPIQTGIQAFVEANNVYIDIRDKDGDCYKERFS